MLSTYDYEYSCWNAQEPWQVSIPPVFIHESVVRGHCITKKRGLVQHEPENLHNRQAVCILKLSTIVGHVPRELSRVFWLFLSHDGTISCEINWAQKVWQGLGSSMSVYKFTGSERMITEMKGILHVKNCHGHYCYSLHHFYC